MARRVESTYSGAELVAADRLGVPRQTGFAIEIERYDPSLPPAFALAVALAHEFRTTIESIFLHDKPER